MSLKVMLHGNEVRAKALLSEAKRRLVKLKESMSFQNLKQLYPTKSFLSDGSSIRVGSVFGIDSIEIVGAGVEKIITEVLPDEVISDLVFLINSASSYQVWQIKSGGGSISALTFDISEFATQYDIDPYEYPSCVKSNVDYNLHRFSLQNIIFVPDTSVPEGLKPAICFHPYCPQFGFKYAVVVSIDPTAYDVVEIGFKENYKDNMLDTTYTNISGAFAYSRRSYIDSNGELIEYLQIYDVDGNTGQIEYVGGGVQKQGAIITYNEDKSDVYAVLNISDVIMIDAGSSYDNSAWIGFAILTYTIYIWTYNEGTDKLLMWGDDVVDNMGSYTLSSDIINDWVQSQTWEGYTWWESFGVGNLLVMDYDDNTVNGNSICIYNLTASGSWYTGLGGVGDMEARFSIYASPPGPGLYWTQHFRWNGITHTGKRKDYKLAYRVNGEDFTVDIIAVSIFLDYQTVSINGGAIGGDSGQITASTRIRAPSVQVTDKYLLYSYVVEDYSASSWAFNKRVIGIINIATGAKTEHEISDIGTLDVSDYAAIGLHRIIDI